MAAGMEVIPTYASERTKLHTETKQKKNYCKRNTDGS